MKASTVATHPNDPERALANAEEIIQHLETRVATLERLLQANAGSDTAHGLPEGEHNAINSLRDSIQRAVDASKVCAVASRGDDRLLLLGGRPAWHFPRLDNGSYTGYHPGDDEAAIAHLEYVRASGADVLVFPDSQLWWFDHYRTFACHLDRHYERIIDETHCRAYSLTERRTDVTSPTARLQVALRRVDEDWGETPTVLDLSGTGLCEDVAALRVHAPDDTANGLPFEDGTVDFVLVPDGDPALEAEARRVARDAVCTVMGGDAPAGIGVKGPSVSDLRIDWQDGSDRRQSSVSVIIPTYNGAHFLRSCLSSLKDTVQGSADVEVIVADDCSTDDTIAFLEGWQQCDDRIRVHRASKNRGFIDTCNSAAKTASNDLLVFLNNDTVLLDGWLSAILRTFRRVDDAGAVGGKLLFPDGRLQEAGGVMFNDGTGANFGKWDPKPAGPLYSYMRDVDFCSGALLATPRALFEELQGFDTHFRPAYYEDTDYCFRVRAQGLRVVYQPESAIVHLEGGTAGTDLTVGPKRAQLRNRQRFLDKWHSELGGRPAPPTQYDLVTWYQLAYAGEEAQ
jgi:GT2 family glycosyltransferase